MFTNLINELEDRKASLMGEDLIAIGQIREIDNLLNMLNDRKEEAERQERAIEKARNKVFTADNLIAAIVKTRQPGTFPVPRSIPLADIPGVPSGSVLQRLLREAEPSLLNLERAGIAVVDGTVYYGDYVPEDEFDRYICRFDDYDTANLLVKSKFKYVKGANRKGVVTDTTWSDMVDAGQAFTMGCSVTIPLETDGMLGAIVC